MWWHPQGLEVLAWPIGDETPEFLPVSALDGARLRRARLWTVAGARSGARS